MPAQAQELGKFALIPLIEGPPEEFHVDLGTFCRSVLLDVPIMQISHHLEASTLVQFVLGR